MSQLTEKKIFRSKVPEDPIKRSFVEQSESLGHLIISRLSERHSNEILYVDFASGREWTGSQLKQAILNIASCLIDEYDFQRGDIVCLNYDHSDYACIFAFGVVCAGGTMCFSNSKDPYNELLYVAKKVEMRYFASKSTEMSKADQLDCDMGYSIKKINLPDQPEKVIPTENGLHMTDFDRMISYNYNKAKCSVPVVCKNKDEEIAFVTFSSGTTGRPKALPSSHRNCLSEVAFTMQTSGIIAVSPNPLDYVSGRITASCALVEGFKLVILNGFNPESYLRVVQQYRITNIVLGAASFHSLIAYEKLADYDISSVRSASPVGAKIVFHQEMLDFLNKYTHILFVTVCYGCSEVGISTRSLLPASLFNKFDHHSGFLNPGTSMKIVDIETGDILGKNQIGSIRVIGNGHFPGYFDVGEARKRLQISNSSEVRLRPSDAIIQDANVFDEDGYYITGDMGFFDDEEKLYITGRLVERMSCRGALKIIPQELEIVLSEHPAVANSCVIPICSKSKVLTDFPRAFVKPKQQCYQMNYELGQDSKQCNQPAISLESERSLEFKGENKVCSLPSETRQMILKDLMKFVNERVGYEKQLTGGIVLIDNLPQTKSSGKVDKRALKSLDLGQIEVYGDLSD